MIELIRRAVRAFCMKTGRCEGIYRAIGKPTTRDWPEWLRRHRGFKIGEGTTIDPDVMFTDLGTVTIGRWCTVTRCKMPTHSVTLEDMAGQDRRCRRNPIVIGDSVEIYVDAVILPGSRIGDGARIMSLARVNGEVPAGAIMEGSPAKIVGTTRRWVKHRAAQMQEKILADRRLYCLPVKTSYDDPIVEPAYEAARRAAQDAV